MKGLNDHPLGYNRSGQRAIDIKGTGAGRGAQAGSSAAVCDIAATGLYLASGDNAKAAIALTATMMDFVPGPYKFNKGANRYISSITGKFVSTDLGKQWAILSKTFGAGLNFLNTK